MEDLQLLEAVERYISGGMNPDERVYFEGLRKSNPEIDQLVVEHTFFLQQLSRFDQTRKLKHSLNEIHMDLSEKGSISSPRLEGRERVFYLFNRYKRTAAIAATIAGVTAVAISVLISTVSPNKPASEKDIAYLKRVVKQQDNQIRQQDNELKKVKSAIGTDPKTVADPKAPVTYKTGGTGFLIDPKGYLVTSAHVVKDASAIALQSNDGKEYAATVAFVDDARDIAILKINDNAYKAPASLPYSIRNRTGDIAEPIFTLGYPRNDIVYGEGYLAALTGHYGDTLSCQIAIAANPGNSGGPILNRNGEVIGVLSARQTSAEGVVFATKSKYIYTILSQLEKSDSGAQTIRVPSTSKLRGMDRTRQVDKIREFVYMVKVN
ncbi:MAG: trypsin-like serine protease [Flaviaesturariibacter sp.]|nr:trypsin-like serine protease [Flaviaesturariibacter sp.]